MVTPPTIAAAAPSRVARRQYTPTTTGMKKLDAMSAVKSSTMNWTSSPSPTPLRSSTTGMVPTTRMPNRSTHSRRPGGASGRNSW